MQTKELADLLGLATNTLRHWTIELYPSYMSPGARGGSGRVRQFSDQDARIIALVASLRTDGLPHEDILATLDSLEANDWADLPSLPIAPPGQGPISVIPREAAERTMEAQRQTLTREIALLTDRVATLEEQITKERTSHDGTRRDLTEAREQLGELRGQLSTLETEHQRERQVIDAERSRERRLLTSGLLVVAIVAAILLAVVVLLALSSAGLGAG